MASWKLSGESSGKPYGKCYEKSHCHSVSFILTRKLQKAEEGERGSIEMSNYSLKGREKTRSDALYLSEGARPVSELWDA